MIRRTKIVATIGPASSSSEVLRELFRAGLNVARVTLAHGNIETQRGVVRRIRAEADHEDCAVAILLDLPGPKVRTTQFDGEVNLEPDDRLTLTSGRHPSSTRDLIVVDYPTLLDDLKVGDVVSIGDGAVQLQIDSVSQRGLAARVLSGARLTGRKGVKIPTARLRAQVPTDEDIELIDAFRAEPVDIIALSFVRTAQDVRAARELIGRGGPWLMAKIETAAAILDLPNIIDSSDAIMVARGDLGTELPIEDVPHLQKRIIRDTVRAGKPVLVATQMLESMIDSPSPTRAEATDVANAVLDQTSAVMLSAETAIGRHPINVVRTMARIITRAERELDPTQLQLFALEQRNLSTVGVAAAHAAWQAANDLKPAAILACTTTGATARNMSSLRPLTPLYGLTADVQTYRRLALCWGVHPILLPTPTGSTEDVMRLATETAELAGAVGAGDVAIVLAGAPGQGPGHTDTIHIVQVARPNEM